MPIRLEDVLEACRLVAEQDQIRICVTESLKGAGIAAATTFTLGVMFGPPGLVVGGAVGGLAGCRMCKKYKPLYQILNEMSQEDKVRLFNHMMRIIQGLDVTDGLVLIAMVTSPEVAARKVFVDGLRTFAQQMA